MPEKYVTMMNRNKSEPLRLIQIKPNLQQPSTIISPSTNASLKLKAIVDVPYVSKKRIVLLSKKSSNPVAKILFPPVIKFYRRIKTSR